MLPEIPLVIGNLKEALPKANFATARSILITTDNEMLNLEIALMARATNPESNLVIGTYKKGLSHNLNHLLKNAQVIGAYEVGAEAFAGAAFGENILGLFRQNNQTILVTEYQIEADDTLNGLLLGEIAYGYGIIVILHQSPSQSPRFMPSDDIPLNAGDRIVVLASGEGLRRIEGGRIRITTRCWRVRVEKVLTDDAIFEGANLISRISGCSLVRARNLMNNLPQTLPTPLYKHQGQRLVRELKRVLVKADLVALSDGSI
ncbi:MAG: NAD-binding protein [Prochloraceae cyanobacterium]|nr:NAD-binding protein [Prochloraceae cyanobacterium]